MNVTNARIKATRISVEHDNLTFMLTLDYGGSHQGFGGYSLEGKDGSGAALIREVLRVVGVDAWEDLAGKYVRVRSRGFLADVDAIGHVIEDRWLNVKEWYACYQREERDE